MNQWPKMRGIYGQKYPKLITEQNVIRIVRVYRRLATAAIAIDIY